ncbi:DNA-binding IclR family transcriptional regulator [Geodermatophilus bullaregiensis]|uniref:IclR family transcriptional regulator n=1 Tax=Geodermatophilus bullaregiensis TaxID=1564160 RepID=UPI00195B1A47|nr:IclR family transcriptional regulator [Geodermatophilus bullaregiensis]MBM7804443.1 DNA-binding IclR family transcriptional regulator [Geodermatophilus bullaregiensis]
MAADDGADAPQSQTLDRGLRILEHLATVAAAQPVAEVAQSVGLHRSIAYRLLRTLEDHQLVERDPAGHYRLGLGMAALARGVRTDLQTAALPQLDALAADLGMTAFLVVRAGDEAVTVASVEPHDTAAHVAYRPGTRHPVGQGAPGLALLMPEPPSADDRAALREARRVGWASSHGEVIPGLRSIAAPVLGPDGGARAALAVVHVDDRADVQRIGRAVAEAAATVTAALS